MSGLQGQYGCNDCFHLKRQHDLIIQCFFILVHEVELMFSNHGILTIVYYPWVTT